MPRRHVQTHMIVKTDKGLVLIDKEGKMTPLADKKKAIKKQKTLDEEENT